MRSETHRSTSPERTTLGHTLGLGDHQAQRLQELSAGDLFNMLDLDKSGQLDKEEFNKLYDVMCSAIKQEFNREHVQQQRLDRSRRRGKAALILSAVLILFLGLSITANFFTVAFVVGREVTTSTDESSGVTVDKRTGSEVLVAQSGVEVSLGLLPYLPLHAPEMAVESSPEFVVISGGGDIGMAAHRIASIKYQPPTRLTLNALDGTTIVLAGAATGIVYQV